GGAGLVGSHLCDRLLAQGNEVIAVDDLSTGSFANIAHLKREARFAFVEHDLAEPFRADVDAVVHLATPSGATSDMARVAGTIHVLEAASSRAARVVLTSRWPETDATRFVLSMASS